MKMKKLPSLDLINTLFTYDEGEGLLIWDRDVRGGVRKGDIAGSLKPMGNTSYRMIRICGKLYPLHRIIYKMHNPDWDEEGFVDHIESHPIADNRISNLRLANNSENLMNQLPQKNRSSIYKGVSFNKQLGKWESSIHIDGIKTHLGVFQNEILAAKAYDKKAFECFGIYARPNFPLDGHNLS